MQRGMSEKWNSFLVKISEAQDLEANSCVCIVGGGVHNKQVESGELLKIYIGSVRGTLGPSCNPYSHANVTSILWDHKIKNLCLYLFEEKLNLRGPFLSGESGKDSTRIKKVDSVEINTLNPFFLPCLQNTCSLTQNSQIKFGKIFSGLTECPGKKLLKVPHIPPPSLLKRLTYLPGNLLILLYE